MTVHRKRRRRPSAPRRRAGTYRGQLAEGDDLAEAADVIARAAKAKAAGNGMPETAESVSVQVDGDTAVIYSDAPAAYPNEVKGVRHPTFGHKPTVTNEHRPFLAPAADEEASAAMERYSKKLDRMLRKAGFR